MIINICPRCQKTKKMKSKENIQTKKFCEGCKKIKDHMSILYLEDIYDLSLEDVDDCITDLWKSYHLCGPLCSENKKQKLESYMKGCN